MNKEYVISKLAQYVEKKEEAKINATGKVYGTDTFKKGKTFNSATTMEFDTPNGKRLYTGAGASGRQDLATDKAGLNAKQNAAFSVADSTPYAKVPNLKQVHLDKVKALK